MEIKKVPQALKYLWEKKFFDNRQRNFQAIKLEIKKELHCTFPDNTLYVALSRAKYLTKEDSSYTQRIAPKGIVLNEEIFAGKVIKVLGKDFQTEISDLNLNYGKSGTCTAFILRKILEKLIFLTFAKNGLSDKLTDNKGNFVGLKDMINLAASNKVDGKPFLMPKTAKEIEGMKFLGDTSAHNPLTNVSMKTIIPQMPFIITAYEELSKKL